ncbi:hypothetical protein K438DRAFT_1964988 [Mycena galopus ATCC 62051]|nr:hypothetical protein K438DRAFT_1964988 [Mycena galopus ATCC 62051]
MGTTYDLTLGCLLVSSWANMVLFTLEIKEIFNYFGRYKRDPVFNKIMVLTALSGDILTVFACVSSSYLYMVSVSDHAMLSTSQQRLTYFFHGKHWGELDYVASQPWGIAGYVIGTGITGAAVQIFLTRMVFNLTQQWIWLPILALFIMVGLTGAGATAATLITSRAISSREGLVKWVTVWLSGCVAADTFITIILVVKFQTLKAAFVGTSELLRRLSLAAIRNGSITTTITIVTVVLFKIQPETNSALMLEITIGRVYTLCMLSNLNNRVWLTNQSTGVVDVTSAAFNRNPTTATESNQTTSALVRIQTDIEHSTDYENGQRIPMDPLVYGKRKPGDMEHGNVGYVDVSVVICFAFSPNPTRLVFLVTHLPSLPLGTPARPTPRTPRSHPVATPTPTPYAPRLVPTPPCSISLIIPFLLHRDDEEALASRCVVY